MGKLNNFISNLREKPFIKSLINDLNSDIYVVGGATRDLILNKQNKDIDLIIRKIPIDTLITHLQKFGRVDVVGKSFGVIKFIDSDGIDYDLALPRKEQPTGEGGYRGFDVQSDENLPIEDDLIRRDAKMNAMAININTGKFIDPLGGLKDIENKQISAANPEAFSDDPLRMIRMVTFASRFGFTIDPDTMKMIQKNAGRVKEIAPERILTEFDKIIKNNK
jgi:tRNA nucleotidyltransferase (CCA-adding enzyme)